MSDTRPNSTAVAALSAEHLKPAFFGFLDFADDPLRATTWPANVAFSGTGDDDLDGNTFAAFKPEFIDVSDVKYQDGGSESVTCKLSGLILPDADLLNTINDETNWKGRDGRLWQSVYNAANVQQGVVWNYYTGTLVNVEIEGDPGQQVISVTLETYLASLSEASNRTYLDQADFDPDDHSAEAAIAIANGNTGTTLVGGGGVGGYGGAAGGGGFAGTVMRALRH